MKKFMLFDLLKLRTGKSSEDAKAYFDGLTEIFERHGLSRSDEPMVAMKTLRGSAGADVINLWETDNPETSMQGMAGDPEYQAKVPERDAIFDLESSSVILAQRT